MRIKVMADYHCHPLWWDGEPGRVGNLDPATLGLSAGLVVALDAWAARFDATLDPADPSRSGFPTPMGEAAFRQEGRALAGRIAAELGGRARVRFRSGA